MSFQCILFHSFQIQETKEPQNRDKLMKFRRLEMKKATELIDLESRRVVLAPLTSFSPMLEGSKSGEIDVCNVRGKCWILVISVEIDLFSSVISLSVT
jgi:hypothetical protein